MENNSKLSMIYNQNCLDSMKLMPDDYIDLVVTSPPYGKIRTYDGYVDSFIFDKIATALYRVCKPGAVIVWITADQKIKGSESLESFRQVIKFRELGFLLHDTMIYQRHANPNTSPTNSYFQEFEYMFVLSKDTKPNTVNLIRDHKNKYTDTRKKYRNPDGSQSTTKHTHTTQHYSKRPNIWRYNTGSPHATKYKPAYKHPAIFPEQLAIDHIISWSNRDDIVYDPMAGSGTVPVMAYKLFRQYIASEINPEYYKIMCDRLLRTGREEPLDGGEHI